MERQPYEPPRIEVIEIEIERGFMVSSVDVNPWGAGGTLNGGEAEEIF